MPKDTNGTLIQKFNAALQLLQMVSDKVGCPEPHSRPRVLLSKKCFKEGEAFVQSGCSAKKLVGNPWAERQYCMLRATAW